jgi:1,4-dihydroxy-2-naphthoate octaprenyltransferase
VLVGTAAADRFVAWRSVAALVVAVSMQVGVNYANDYFDAVGGVDTVERVGPRRVVAAGLVAPERMRTAAAAAFAVTAAAGLALAAAAGWELLLVGALAILAALGYSGGPRPYASAGLGEASVFVFFGLVATVGSQYVQDERVGVVAAVAAVPVGLLATAILVANNLRDLPTDAVAGKATLAVRLGPARTRAVYTGLLLAAVGLVPVVAVAAGSRWPLLGLAAAPLGLQPLRAVRAPAGPAELIAALAGTARFQLVFAALLAAGLLVA